MIERLFVYGTLGPSRSNEHVLSVVGGTWEEATVNGDLRFEGWGAIMGYPGIDLNEQGGEVKGFLFSSKNLPGHWKTLDAFEGEAYKRVLAKVKLKDGSLVDANIYTLRAK